ncbi:hypothetical protein RI129_006851 [Pyrocoelia pectoralis]|uniref:Uncharacterized protein n=1 Tax=Pyrocoelia pectoralis TaxID=417401 RepID=A0AAN7VH43_9COLE
MSQIIKCTYLADYFSQNYMKDNTKNFTSFGKSIFKQFEQNPISDANLKQIINWYQQGWPVNKNYIKDKELETFYKLKDKIHVTRNIVYYNDRIVAPKVLRQEMLNLVHAYGNN